MHHKLHAACAFYRSGFDQAVSVLLGTILQQNEATKKKIVKQQKIQKAILFKQAMLRKMIRKILIFIARFLQNQPINLHVLISVELIQ
jgi:predicted NodU family carbamoyl transferase